MLFMAISSPRAEHPSSQIEARKTFWPWMAALQKTRRAHWCYARPGRGAVALFDVMHIEELHQYLNEWADIIPVQFEIYPLLDAKNAKAFLGKGANVIGSTTGTNSTKGSTKGRTRITKK